MWDKAKAGSITVKEARRKKARKTAGHTLLVKQLELKAQTVTVQFPKSKVTRDDIQQALKKL